MSGGLLTLTPAWQRRLAPLGALVAGSMLVCAFAPFTLYWLVWPALVLFWGTLVHAEPRQALWRGYCFGLGSFGFGVSWIYVSVTFLGSTPLWLAVAITVLFIGVLSLFPALFAYLSNRLFAPGWLRTLLVYPAFWVLMELARTWIWTGFPWLFVGYTQTSTVLASYAALGGVYLVSLVVALIAALVMMLWQWPCWWQKLLGVLAIGLITGGGWLVGQVSFVYTNPQPRSVLLVQGNIQQQDKWQPGKTRGILERYYHLTRTHISSDMLVFWPENAVPRLPGQVPWFMDKLEALAQANDASILLGLPIRGEDSGEYYNGAMVVGYGQGIYKKHLLVPFGEYFPLKWLTRPLMQLMQVPMSDFSAGTVWQAPVNMSRTAVATLICYESAFPELVRHNSAGAQLLAVLSDDAWFGDTFGAWQHLQMTRMRAIESGRYVIQATNNGVTAIITNKGELLKKLPRFQAGALVGKIYPAYGQTPWCRYGLAPVVMLLGLMLIIKLVLQPAFTRTRYRQ